MSVVSGAHGKRKVGSAGSKVRNVKPKVPDKGDMWEPDDERRRTAESAYVKCAYVARTYINVYPTLLVAYIMSTIVVPGR